LEDEEEDLCDTAKEELLKAQLTRTKQPNLSYFASTATPKHKTLLVKGKLPAFATFIYSYPRFSPTKIQT